MSIDFKEADEDIWFRGDGLSSRQVTIGRQDTAEDVVNIDTDEKDFTVNRKRVAAQVDVISGLAGLSTNNLNECVVQVLGKTTLGDKAGGRYYYRSTGRSGVTTDGFDLVVGPGADDYYERLDPDTGNGATGTDAFVGGGDGNTATGNFSFVGGGENNTASASHSTVTAGATNIASANHSFVGGGLSNEVSSLYGVISGGVNNHVHTDEGGTIAGGNTNEVSGYYGFVGSGFQNDALQDYSAVVVGHTNVVNGTHSFIGAGTLHTISGSGYAFIGGGYDNDVTAQYSVITGGRQNVIGGIYGFIGGGYQNEVDGNHSTIAGGHLGDIDADYAVIGGGSGNTVSANYASVIGGLLNQAGGVYSVVAGRSNAVSSTGDYSATFGQSNDNQGSHSLMVGKEGLNSADNSITLAGSQVNVLGDTQTVEVVAGVETTDATVTNLAYIPLVTGSNDFFGVGEAKIIGHNTTTGDTIVIQENFSFKYISGVCTFFDSTGTAGTPSTAAVLNLTPVVDQVTGLGNSRVRATTGILLRCSGKASTTIKWTGQLSIALSKI